MTLSVNHNVSIVPVLDLQQVADDRICSHGFDEIAASGLEFFRTFVAVLVQEVLVQSRIRLSTQLIARFCIGDALNYTALCYKKESNSI